MTTCFLAPDPIQSCQLIPGGNTPANGGQLFFYVAGSSTKQTAYKDNAAAVAWSNPIVLDSGGNLPLGGEVWFPTGKTFKVIFAPANDTDPPASPYWTKDNLSGMNDVSATISEWASGPAPTFIGTTSFSVAGDQTLTFTKGRRLKTTNTGGTVYSTITSVTFGGGVTTVRVTNDSGSLDAGLSAVFYGLLDPANSSIDFYHVGKDGGTTSTNVSGTTDIWGIPGTQVHINNTNAIFSFSSASYAGAARTVIVDVAFPLNTSAVLSIPGGKNVTTSVGDRFDVIASTQAAAIITNYMSNNAPPLYVVPQTSNQIFAGPASGVASTAGFRTLVGAEASMVLLDAQSFANTSACNFTTGITASFDEYELLLHSLVPVTDAQDLWLRISFDGGATFNASGAGYTWAAQRLSTLAAATNSSAADSKITTMISLTNTGGPQNAVFRFNNPASTSIKKMFFWTGGYQISTGGAAIAMGSGYMQSSTVAMNALQFLMSAGNVSSATGYLYGIRKS